MKKTIKASQIHARSGAPNGAGAERQQKGMANVFKPHVSDDALRKMDHPEWLEQFAKVMQMQTGVEMTPMRAGVINRCEMAAQYIKLLEGESRALATKLAESERQLDRARKLASAVTEELIRERAAGPRMAASASDQ